MLLTYSKYCIKYIIYHKEVTMRVISGTARGTKLNSIDSNETRPTLDRVKESLFNIVQNKIEDSVVLDLFAGSGSIGIEFLSRGTEKVYFCEKSHLATQMIIQNLEKTRLKSKSEILEMDFKKCLSKLSKDNIKLMQKGKAPISVDGKSVNLHHVNGIKTDPLNYIELTRTEHYANFKSLHPWL